MIEFLGIRCDVKFTLKDLSNKEGQEKYWMERRGEPNDFINMVDTYHIFFDDTDLFNRSKSSVGSILINEDEHKHILYVTEKLDEIDEKYDDFDDDKDYLRLPEWPAVVESARLAYEKMDENDKKYKIKYWED